MRNDTASGWEPDREAGWRERIADWSRSGETITEYCERRGLSRWTFYGWKRKLKTRAGVTSPFVPVHVVKRSGERKAVRSPVTLATGAGVELVLGCGRRLRLERGFDPATLTAAVAALEGRAC
ncbi:MAG: IS66 family insertion sequence element accessory protein TnpA [Candidatus Binatia bacterium]